MRRVAASRWYTRIGARIHCRMRVDRSIDRTQHPNGAPDWSKAPQGWRRQYVGLVRGGRRFLYGNFYPRSADEYRQDPDQWRREPVMVCDGGPAFFGVEYDVESGRFTHFGFNAIIAKVYKGPSWFDQKECIVLDYSKTSLVARWIRDEIRLIDPNFYLGRVYWGEKPLIHFALEFPPQ